MRVSAGVLLRNPEGQILFVKTWVRRIWEYPAGMVDRNEAPAVAARRELLEETGLEVAEVRLIGVTHFKERMRGGRLHLTFAGGVSAEAGAKVRPQAMEIAEWRWVDYDEAVGLASGELRERLEALRVAPDNEVVYREESSS